jgi:carbonic anhydrase
MEERMENLSSKTPGLKERNVFGNVVLMNIRRLTPRIRQKGLVLSHLVAAEGIQMTGVHYDPISGRLEVLK